MNDIDYYNFYRKTLAVPIIDAIDYNTLEQKSVDSFKRGIWEWGFLYKVSLE